MATLEGRSLQVAGAVLRPRRRRGPPRRPRRRPPAPSRVSDSSPLRCRSSSASLLLEAVEAVGGEDRAGDQAVARPPRRRLGLRQRQASERRLEPPAVLRRERRGDPGALGVELLALAEADDEGAPGALGMHQGRLLVRALRPRRRALPAQRLGEVVALEDQTPSRSASTSASGLSATSTRKGRQITGGALTFRSSELRGTDRRRTSRSRASAQTKGADAQDSHPLHRPDPLREDGRRALVPRRHRPRRHRDLRGARARRGRPRQVQEVVFGQVLQAGQGQIPSRQAQIKAGIPREVPSETVNKVCASGMRSIGHRRSGDPRRRPRDRRDRRDGVDEPGALPAARRPLRLPDGRRQAVDSMTHDGLTNPFTEKQMINEASEVSNELEITRADMDRFAERSHQLAAQGDRGRQARRGDRHASPSSRGRARTRSRPTRRSGPTPRSRPSPS